MQRLIRDRVIRRGKIRKKLRSDLPELSLLPLAFGTSAWTSQSNTDKGYQTVQEWNEYTQLLVK